MENQFLRRCDLFLILKSDAIIMAWGLICLILIGGLCLFASH